jgi:diacylglycerol kinase family enzyme
VRAKQAVFIQLAGVGLDAQVVQATSWNFKKNFGPLSYVISPRKSPRASRRGSWWSARMARAKVHSC